MTGLSWWRSWHGAPVDHKWPVIAARSGVKVGIVSAIAWALLDYASQQEDRGSVVGFDPEEYAVYSGFSEDEINAVIQAMTDKGIIKDGRLVNWEKRQPKREDEGSNARVRKHRELKRNVTQCNAPDKDTDKDTEEEAEQTPPAAAESAPKPPDPVVGELTASDAEELYQTVTGLIPDVGRYDWIVQMVRNVHKRNHHPPRSLMLEIMQKSHNDWKGCKTADGKPYNPSNPDWLQWCSTGYAPAITPHANGKQPRKITGRGVNADSI